MVKNEQADSLKLIQSRSNPQFKDWQKLLQSRGIKDAGQALIFGSKVTAETIRKAETAGRALGWIVAPDMGKPDWGEAQATPTYRLADDLFKDLDVFGTRTPILWIRVPDFADLLSFKVEPGSISLVIPFQNPENVGALLRSAAAFGVQEVILTEECAHPFHPKSVRAASGALLLMKYFRGPKLEMLQLPWECSVGLSAEGAPIGKLQWPRGGILIPGIEGPGLPAELRKQLRLGSIPMAAGVESLNGMVATSLALYEWRKFLSPGKVK